MAIEWVTTLEAAELSGYHPERIRELIRDRRIVAIKKGNAWWVDRASLVAYVKAAKQMGDRRHGPKRKRT
jgi:excisionase family DNA binding protein